MCAAGQVAKVSKAPRPPGAPLQQNALSNISDMQQQRQPGQLPAVVGIRVCSRAYGVAAASGGGDRLWLAGPCPSARHEQLVASL